MKILLFIIVALTIFSKSLGDTKVLHNISIYGDNFNRDETYSLNNPNTPEEELVIKGKTSQEFDVANDFLHVYKVETVYVADKDGYRVKYILVREDRNFIGHTDPNTLKSLVG